MTFECQVDRGYPVAMAVLSGTLDQPAAASGAAALQSYLADDQPVALVLDVTGLTVAGPAAARPLAELAHGARRWPGTALAVGGAGAETQRMLAEAAVTDPVEGFEFFPDADAARSAGLRRPVPPRATCDLPPTEQAPAMCRELIARACRTWGISRLRRRAELVASELVSNAVVHARTPLSFSVRHPDSALQLAVRDGDRRLVARVPPDPEQHPLADVGRGQLLLETIADDWGCVPTTDGKVVWASLMPTPPPSSASG